MYSSPKYLGPECISFKINDLELNTLFGFTQTFLFYFIFFESISDLIRPDIKDLGRSDCSSYLSKCFFAFLIFSTI